MVWDDVEVFLFIITSVKSACCVYILYFYSIIMNLGNDNIHNRKQ
jgi:hypothetical protein